MFSLLVGGRLNKFSVHGSGIELNPLLDPNKQTCYTFNGNFGESETKTLECSPQINARYKYIY